MPSIDTFAQLSYEDDVGVQVFLQAHAARHSIYQQSAVKLGFPFANTNLTSYPDDDWFQRHYDVHGYLNSLTPPDPTVNIATLLDYDWSDADSFYNWMQMHTLLHQRIDHFFGMGG